MPRPNAEHPAEEFLRSQGLIERRTIQRRALLGCVGCRWLKAIQKGEDPTFYGREVMRCTDLVGSIVYPTLDKLAGSGVMVRDRESLNPLADNLPPRVLYRPAASELGEAFLNSLQVPTECALELEGNTQATTEQ